MKKTGIINKLMALVALFAISINASAQGEQMMEMQQKISSGYEQFKQSFYSGKYKEAEAAISEVINLLDTTTIYKNEALQIPEEVIVRQKGVMQYDLACCYAIWGKKKQAMLALEQSVNNGYDMYDNMLNDKDLQSLHKEKKYPELLEKVRKRVPLEVLKSTNAYQKEEKADIPPFMYCPKEHPNLGYVREYFQLDTIPGKGNELEHIKNLLHFAHDNIRHDGSNRAICEFTSIDIYNYSKATGRGVNCRQLAISLCDMYLAMGYKARVVTCLPADPLDTECHVINTVWSETLQKWLYIDPTMDAWVMDENGVMLSIAEVRERLVNSKPLVLCETANWNHENTQTKEYYLETYMAKNLYYFVCKNRSFFNQESIYRSIDNEDIRLIPEGFVNNNYGAAKTTTDPEIFWAKPMGFPISQK